MTATGPSRWRAIRANAPGLGKRESKRLARLAVARGIPRAQAHLELDDRDQLGAGALRARHDGGVKRLQGIFGYDQKQAVDRQTGHAAGPASVGRSRKRRRARIAKLSRRRNR